jgi:hypothetical protein
MKYRNSKFNVEKNLYNHYEVKPINYNTRALIIEKTKEECIKSNKKYLDRVLHYNYNK